MFQIHFVSLDHLWIEEIQRWFGINPRIQITHGNLQDIPLTKHHTLVSPCNSLGQMTGGIDYVLSRILLPGCEAYVRNRIRLCPTTTILGRHYLDIGSALYIPLSTYQSSLLVAPTMFTPEDVRTTQNAYLSFLAALHMMKKWHSDQDSDKILVVTSHCCGFGCMDPVVSAQQMVKAYEDFVQNRVHEHTDSQSVSDCFKLDIHI